MNYQIKIIKVKPNPDYKEEMAAYQKINVIYQKYDEHPIKETVEDVLICELTEDQFKKVKAEVLKVFE